MMTTSRAKIAYPRTRIPLVMGVSVLTLSGCQSFFLTMKGDVEPEPVPGVLYQAAIRDAAVIDSNRADVALRTVVGGRIRVVAWAAPDLLQTGANRLSNELWVSQVPEIQEKCAGYKGELAPRLKQLQGLPLSDKRSVFVEMEVDSADVFRPCPNPDPSLSTCSAEFPEDITPEYLAWFARHSARARQIPGGSPFTGLGYTYDWNQSTGRYGVSELVIRNEAWIDVVKISEPGVYCGPTPVTPLTPLFKHLD